MKDLNQPKVEILFILLTSSLFWAEIKRKSIFQILYNKKTNRLIMEEYKCNGWKD